MTLTDIGPIRPEHFMAAGFEPGELPDRDSYAWHLDDVRWVEPFAVKGQLHFFDVPDERIAYVAAVVMDCFVLREMSVAKSSQDELSSEKAASRVASLRRSM